MIRKKSGRAKGASRPRVKVAVALRDIKVKFGEEVVLSDFSVDFLAGKSTAIVGPNGAGKSTLVKVMLGLVNYRGNVEVLGQKSDQMINSFSYVPQRTMVDWNFPISVQEVATMGCYQRVGLFRGVPVSEQIKVRQALRDIGMEGLRDRPIGSLSGGQQQRVFLARALVQDSPIMLLDEPFTGVDAETEKKIVSILKEEVNLGTTVICVHHNLHTLSSYFDNLVMINRALIASGKMDEVFTQKNTASTFGFG